MMASMLRSIAELSQDPEHPPLDANDRSPAQGVGLLRPTRILANGFRLFRTLGSGTFSRVYLALPAVSITTPLDNDPAPRVYALKALQKAEIIRLKQVEHLRQERAILTDVAGHPFITNFLDSFVDNDTVYLIFDYIPGGELFTYLRLYRRFNEPVSRFYAAEIVLAFEFLHEHQGKIAYRDLKLENILLDQDGHIKLVDFGFAKRLGVHENQVETYTLCGTPEYVAPEIVKNTGHTTAVDWWALGILIYEFLTGNPPFQHQRPLEIYRRIIEEPIIFPHDITISEPAKNLILSFCTVDCSKRLGNSRGGASRVKSHRFFHETKWDDILHRRRRGPIIPPVRYASDSRCFDIYPEDDGKLPPYTAEMAKQYDEYFADF